MFFVLGLLDSCFLFCLLSKYSDNWLKLRTHTHTYIATLNVEYTSARLALPHFLPTQKTKWSDHIKLQCTCHLYPAVVVVYQLPMDVVAKQIYFSCLVLLTWMLIRMHGTSPSI